MLQNLIYLIIFLISSNLFCMECQRPDIPKGEGETPLYVPRVEYKTQGSDLFRAIKNGDIELAEILIVSGADVNERDRFGSTPLIYATMLGDENLARLLIEKGADPLVKDNFGDTALMYAKRNRDKWLIELLQKAESRAFAPSTIHKTGVSDLIIAILNNDIDLVDSLILSGANVNEKDDMGNTPLIWASKFGYTDIVKSLIGAGANVNQKDLYNNTALIWASKLGNAGIVQLLINAGADINAINNKKESAISSARAGRHQDVVNLLVVKLIQSGAKK